MGEVRALAEIRLWNKTVGGVVELDDDRIVFEFDQAAPRALTFRRSTCHSLPRGRSNSRNSGARTRSGGCQGLWRMRCPTPSGPP